MKRLFLAVVLVCAVAAPGAADEAEIATLYRSSPVIKNARIHVATFDAVSMGSEPLEQTTFDYNWENCLIAAELFQHQEGVKVRYWCEKGRFSGKPEQ